MKMLCILGFIARCIAAAPVLALAIPCILLKALFEACYEALEWLCGIIESALDRLSRNLWAMGTADAVKIDTVEAGDYLICNMKCGACGEHYGLEAEHGGKPRFCPSCGRKFTGYSSKETERDD